MVVVTQLNFRAVASESGWVCAWGKLLVLRVGARVVGYSKWLLPPPGGEDLLENNERLVCETLVGDSKLASFLVLGPWRWSAVLFSEEALDCWMDGRWVQFGRTARWCRCGGG